MNGEIILGGLSILFAGMVVLVPVLGLTLRLAIKPFFDSWAEIQRGRNNSEHVALLARQIEVMEAEMQQVQQALGSVLEGHEFQRRLADSAAADRLAAGRSSNGSTVEV